MNKNCEKCVCFKCQEKIKYTWCDNCKLCKNYQTIIRLECTEKHMINKLTN